MMTAQFKEDAGDDRLTQLADTLFRKTGVDGVYARTGLYEGVVEALASLISSYRPAGAEVEVADFRVAELPLGQADPEPAGLELGGGVAPAQVVELGHARDEGGVEGIARPVPESVENEESNRTSDHG